MLFRPTGKQGIWLAVGAGYLALIGLIVYGFYGYRELEQELSSAAEEITFLSYELEQSQQENANLAEDVASQQAVIDSFSGQISSITSTVGTLEKLAATDPELLKKYSRVY